MLKVTLPALVPSNKLSHCEIGLADPATALLIFVFAEGVYENPVPLTELLSITFVRDPSKVLWPEALAIGMGLTFTTVLTALPVQPLAEGVIEYVAVPEVLPLVLERTSTIEVEEVLLADDAPETFA